MRLLLMVRVVLVVIIFSSTALAFSFDIPTVAFPENMTVLQKQFCASFFAGLAHGAINAHIGRKVVINMERRLHDAHIEGMPLVPIEVPVSTVSGNGLFNIVTYCAFESLEDRIIAEPFKRESRSREANKKREFAQALGHGLGEMIGENSRRGDSSIYLFNLNLWRAACLYFEKD